MVGWGWRITACNRDLAETPHQQTADKAGDEEEYLKLLYLLHAPVGIVKIMTGEEIPGPLKVPLNKITGFGQKWYVEI